MGNFEIQKVGVVGGGPMGSGIAQVVAYRGRDVVLVEVSEDKCREALGRAKASLDRFVKRERISQADADAAVARIRVTTDLSAVSGCDVVVEAIFEAVELKKAVFAQLDVIVRPDALLASNTSTIPIVLLGAATKHPERVVGMHFFNPVPMMALVEIIRAPAADELYVEAARAFVVDLGKSPVVCNDVPGFIGNLLVVPFLIDAMRQYEKGIASMEAIDEVIKLGFNHPMGPFALSDLIGLDIVHEMAASIYEETKEARYYPPNILKQMVRMGRYGRKTGRGFFTYE
jgi:3-hydroxybutyryl-CoA dehydrogenase